MFGAGLERWAQPRGPLNVRELNEYTKYYGQKSRLQFVFEQIKFFLKIGSPKYLNDGIAERGGGGVWDKIRRARGMEKKLAAYPC